ncbi:OLC1v1003311C1 [Oldenlandia corymbosa var. corymbosa]|uniref:OLC1v1003311C1 n=1 Tax=Oldenlandia corymbosa var. corymbosa TaxID=529605 RepID=A0AAV1D9R5_OLDCO|nr:OLC1v1003311C1 [Oldenlandia corymbosa var. corymbosa]
MAMMILSKYIPFLLLVHILSLQTFPHHHLALADDPTASQARKALEIVIAIGAGIDSSPPAEAPTSPGYELNSPPPPPDHETSPSPAEPPSPPEYGTPPPPPPPCPPPPPPPPPCPPPPPPPFESKRIELVFPVIQQLKKKITDDPKGITKTWVGPDICNKYKGFRCAVVPDFGVKGLSDVQFNGFNFGGPELTLDGFIDQLPDLSIFHANSNKFTGLIPKKITNIKYLFELDLSNNNFGGQFPYEVIGATKLTFLDLRFNKFSGAVPPQVFTLDLDVLFINNNNFRQTLPDNLFTLPALYLTLANNKLTGPIPCTIGQASRTLSEVLFLNNQLSGCLPSEIGLLKKLTVFDVSRNSLTGQIPYSLGCLTNMEILNLANNQFNGVVPDCICNLPNLKNFTLSYNFFTGVGPACLKLIKKGVLDVKKNCIPGLPNQRSKQECDAFACKPKSCPNPQNHPLNWMPCGQSIRSSAMARRNAGELAAKPSELPLSYKALHPH